MPKFIAIAVATAFLLGGCVSHNPGFREGVGALTGAAGGAFLGDKVGKGRGRVLATAAGTVTGLAVGADIGRSLDRANELYEARARGPIGHSQQTPVPGFAPAPPAGEGHSARGTSGSTIREARDCRALNGGGLRPAFACRNSAGQWFVLQ